MVVDRTWRPPDRRCQVDEIIDEPGMRHRLRDAKGAPVAELVDDDQLQHLLDDLDMNPRRVVTGTDHRPVVRAASP